MAKARWILVAVMVMGLLVGFAPDRSAEAAQSLGCAILDISASGSDTMISSGTLSRFYFAGEQVSVTVTLVDATMVHFEMPQGNVLHTFTADGTFNYTIPADGNYSTYLVVASLPPAWGFYYDYGCTGVASQAVVDTSVPGADMVDMPVSSVGGTLVENTVLYFAPYANAIVEGLTLDVGQSVWVTGVSADGMYYQIVLSGSFLWVPANVLGPNYDDLWGGTPLPTNVVN